MQSNALVYWVSLMFSGIYAYCKIYHKCCYAECHYSECRGATQSTRPCCWIHFLVETGHDLFICCFRQKTTKNGRISHWIVRLAELLLSRIIVFNTKIRLRTLLIDKDCLLSLLTCFPFWFFFQKKLYHSLACIIKIITAIIYGLSLS